MNLHGNDVVDLNSDFNPSLNLKACSAFGRDIFAGGNPIKEV
jgi:hypothetical protein